jgi:nucleotide-binding universal stress UspA family protein
MTQFKSLHLALALLCISLSPELLAGQIFRFQDENGITTMSKVMPPYAAKTGYDILDDRSFRLIEHVDPELTDEQIIEEEKRITAEKEAQHQAELAEKASKEAKRRQAIYDNNLRASYVSDQDLLNAKDVELTYLNNMLDKTIIHKNKNEERLHQLEQLAANAELAGKKVTENQQKSIAAAQTEIVNDDAEIIRLKQEIEQRTKQFESDLQPLRELLAKD